MIKYVDVDIMDNPTVVGNRLYKIRYVAGYGGDDQQRKYAETLLMREKSYSHWETGHAMIPTHMAVAICEWTQAVTLDYIYRGRADLLPPAWGLAIRAAPERPRNARRGPRRRTKR